MSAGRHSVYGSLPRLFVWKVEDEEVVFGWSSAGTVTMLARKLEVIRGTRYSQHDAVKALMILK